MSIEACTDTSPAAVWSRYIAQRRPCIFRSHSKDLKGLLDLLKRDEIVGVAGGDKVSVELRSGQGRAFGNGRKVQMTVAEALDKLHSGSEELYLSTQDAPVEADGFPALLTPPLDSMVDHGLPLKPEVMGNLVPQAVNVWMGNSRAGASSGLHHDFHDNLYVLLRGSKRFRLFPPAMADRMYTHGTIDRIHDNGRIVYKGQGDVVADGADAADVRRWRLKRQADGAAAPQQPPQGEDGAGADSGSGDSAVEAALDAALDAAGSDDYDDYDDDYDDGDDDGSSGDGGGGEGGEATARGARVAAGAQRDDNQEGRGVASGDDATPDSFSKVDMTLPQHELRRRFPLFPGAAAAQEVVLRAGEMLFLPASWFHEVTSTSAAAAAPHAAVNYWFHPPDALGAAGGGRFPYSTDFWPDAWNARVARNGWDAALAVPLREGGAEVRAGKRKRPSA